MKKLLSATLLIVLCAITFEATAQNDSINISEPARLSVSEIQFQPSDTTLIPKMWRLKSDFSNYEPLTLNPDHVFNVYVGLRRGEEYEKQYKKAQTAILQLNDLVQSQTEEITAYAAEEIKSSKVLAELNSQLLKKSEEIQSQKDKKAKLYNNPFLYATLGFIGGVLIAK